MNGPVDNPNSGCLGCHGTAQYPLAPMLPGNACNTDAERLQWFRNFTGDVPFGRVDASCVLDPDPTGLVALDFSLQMKVVLQSVLDFHDVNPCAADPEIEAAAGLPEAVVLPQAEFLVLERRSGPIAEQLSSGARQDATRRRSPAVDRLLGKDVADPAVVHLDDLHSRARDGFQRGSVLTFCPRGKYRAAREPPGGGWSFWRLGVVVMSAQP